MTEELLAPTRVRLLQAAGELIEEGGYGAASVAAIADRAGVAAGTLYRHFSSKEELFVELFREVCDREMRAMRAAAEAMPGDAPSADRLETVLALFAERALRRPRLAWALIAEPVDPRVDAERLAYRERYAGLIADTLRGGVVAGELPEQNAELTAAALVGGCGEALVGPLSPLASERPSADEVLSGAAHVRAPRGGGAGMSATGVDAVSDAVRVERDGPVYTVLLSRPGRRNAVDGPTAAALTAAFAEFDHDPEAAVAVLHGEGGVFCAGADLKEVGTEQGNRVSADGDGPMGPTRMRLSKPVIAAVAGHAVAGGLELALWCDLRVAEETAVFGVFCRRWGVPLIDGGTVRLPRLIGLSRALDLILTGRPVDAAEAERIGLVNRVVGVGESRQAAERLARELAAFPQTCLREDRLSALEQDGLSEAAAMAGELEHGLRSLAEVQAGLERFRSGAGRHGSFDG